MKGIIKIVSIITLFLASSGVWAQTNTKVIGELEGLEAGTVVCLVLPNVKVDSVVAGKGRFEFNLALDEGDTYLLSIGRDYTSFYLQPGIVKIKGKASPMSGVKLSGSKFADDQNDLKKYIENAEELKKYDQDLADLKKAVKVKDFIRIAALMPRSFERDSVQKELYRKWVMDHPSSPLSAMVLWIYVKEKDPEKLEKHLNHLQPEAKQNRFIKQLQERLEKAKLTAVGKPAPDFVQNDISGKAVALKDFRGKYVLIDFWGSWCRPCRAENPNVLAAYNRYKDKNFTVLGISVDDNEAEWKKAILDDKLPWTQVSDLKGTNNEVYTYYGITGVPSTLLIDPDGKIIAKDLHGEALHKKLAELLDK